METLIQFILTEFVNTGFILANPLLAIPALVGLGTSIYGGIKEGQTRKRMEQERAAWKQDNANWFNQEYHQDYTQRLDAQNTIRQMREEMDRQGKISEGRQVITGGTNDQALADLENRTKATSNVIASIGANAQNRKDRVMDQYRNRLQQIDALNYQTMGQEAESYGNLMANGLNTMGKMDWASIIGGK